MSVVISCISKSEPIWTFVNKPVSNFVRILHYGNSFNLSMYILWIPQIQRHHAGLYVCYGQDVNDDEYTKFYSLSWIYVWGILYTHKQNSKLCVYIIVLITIHIILTSVIAKWFIPC